jgi:phage gpG-like protein
MDKFNFADKIRKLEEAKTEVPRLLAQIGQSYFQLNFQKAQWDGENWQSRKKETRLSQGKAILVSSGRLHSAMQNTIKSFDFNTIIWAIKDVPYAKYLNEGTEYMPARKMMGNNKELHEKLRRKIESEFKKVLE